MVEGEAGAPYRLAEIPGSVPVRESQADAALGKDGGANPLVKRGQIERFLRAQGMTDRTDPARVHVGLGREQIDGAPGVEEHLGHAGHVPMAVAEPSDSDFRVAASPVVPDEI